MLEWICHLRLIYTHHEGLEDTPLNNNLRNKFLRGRSAFLKSSMIILLCVHSEVSKGESVPLHFLASEGCLLSLLMVPFQSQTSSVQVNLSHLALL